MNREMLGALLLVVGCAGSDEPDDTGLPVDPEPVFTPGDCVVPLAGAQCGTVTVPEVHGSGSERTITLQTAVLPATSGDGAPLALFNGGPGSSVFDLGGLFLDGGSAAPLNQDHDIVLISERGTPGAVPVLDCPELSAVDAIFDAPAEERDAAAQAAGVACAERLRGADVDLGAFDNQQRTADVPMALRALGYDQWHLWGVSGGAMLVQRVIRDAPEGTLSGMVDSGAFPEPDMNGVIVPLLTNASARFERLFAECAADPICGAQFPDLQGQLFGLVAALEADPRPFTVVHPITGETGEVLLDGDKLIQLYTNSMAAVNLLPLVTTLAVNGDFSAIEPQLAGSVVADTGPGFADGLYSSVVCADLGSRTIDDLPTDGAFPEIVSALRPTAEALFAGCRDWDVPALPSGGPVASDAVPMLIMEGMFDTNRDPERAAEVAAHFETAWIAEFADRGHVVFGDCAVSMMAAFMADPTRSPDMSCVPTAVPWVPLY